MQNKSLTGVYLTGGLGNQLFQLAAGMALDSGPLTLEWSLGAPRLNSAGMPEIDSFTLPSRISFEQKRNTHVFIRRVLNFMIRISKSSYRNPSYFASKIIIKCASGLISLHRKILCQVLSPSGIGYSEINEKIKRKFLVGYFQSFYWPEKSRNELMHIKPKKINEEFEKLRVLAQNSRILIVHVRLGDYLSVDTFGIPNPNYYGKAIKYFTEMQSFDEIWIFSNEPENALKHIGDLPQIKHRLIGDLENSSSLVLELMRHGDAYVIANSTFSWWGAYLSYKTRNNVIAPCPWFIGEPSPEMLIPNEWIQIPGYEA